MAFFRTCPNCGANLDPGEVCDCKIIRRMEEKQAKEKAEAIRKLCIMEKNGQLCMAI